MVIILKQDITVLFTWDVNDALKQHFTRQLQHLPQLKLLFPSPFSDDALFDLAKSADVLIGWRHERKKELLLAAEQMKLYINPGAGVHDLIDTIREIKRTREVFFVNSHGNAYATAQHAVALLLTLTNKVIPHHNWMVAGRWRTGDNEASSIPLRDRKIGLLGYGAINQNVHRFLSGFDVAFSILRRNWEKHRRPLPTPTNKYVPSKLSEFLRAIDTLIVSVPQTPLTTELIKMDELQLLGSEGLIVNVARGPIIREADFYMALKERTIAGAGIDTWYRSLDPISEANGKNYPFSYPFHTLDNVVLSPHRGASPKMDLRRWDDVLENLCRFARGKPNLLNMINIDEGY